MYETNTQAPPQPADSGKPGFLEKITNWELWPSWLLYGGLAPFWLYYIIRTRSFWFFTAANPTIKFGGYEGEGKFDIYRQMPVDVYPRTELIKAGEDFEQVKQRLKDAGFEFPFALKPDVGRKGLMFRKIDSEQQLKAYHDYFPFDYVAQELVEMPIELGVFYVRHPSSQKGKITGVFMRESLEVYGDGLTPLRDLILAHPHASKRAESWFKKHEEFLDWIPADRERFVISYAVNRSRGGRLVNISHEADEQLAEFFDRISLHNGQFFWGRYDVKCTSLDDLKQGRNYFILEYNGAGSSPSQIYHCGKTLFQAYAIILEHWRMMYEVAKWNHDKAGVRYWSFMEGYKYLQEVNKYLDDLEKYDLGI